MGQLRDGDWAVAGRVKGGCRAFVGWLLSGFEVACWVCKGQLQGSCQHLRDISRVWKRQLLAI